MDEGRYWSWWAWEACVMVKRWFLLLLSPCHFFVIALQLLYSPNLPLALTTPGHSLRTSLFSFRGHETPTIICTMQILPLWTKYVRGIVHLPCEFTSRPLRLGRAATSSLVFLIKAMLWSNIENYPHSFTFGWNSKFNVTLCVNVFIYLFSHMMPDNNLGGLWALQTTNWGCHVFLMCHFFDGYQGHHRAIFLCSNIRCLFLP